MDNIIFFNRRDAKIAEKRKWRCWFRIWVSHFYYPTPKRMF